MKENTNRAIAVNSIILYVRMLISAACSILTTRFALQALGVIDFGLYSVLGGIITFISIFNTIMITTSNRFIAVAIGKGDIEDANKQFNVNLSIHIIIALVTLLLAFPIGYWYIQHFINYDGDISKAIMVYNISIAAAIFSFVGVPYNGLLVAKEKFIVFSSIDVLSHIGKMVVAYVLVFHFSEKLLIYTIALAFFAILPVCVYIIYCSTRFRDIAKIKIVKEKSRYKEVLHFSLWVSVGAIAMVGKNQGASLLVNGFFNTVMNTAMGIAHSIVMYISMFSANVTHPIAPQITKSYAANDIKRTDELLLMSTKYAFLLMLLVSSPFLVAPHWLLNIWLGQVPPYAVLFLVLMIVDSLVMSLNSGISNLIFASGRIKTYQIITSILNVLSVIFGYFVLTTGVPAYSLILVYIGFSALRVLAIQWILHKTLNYDNWKIIKKSYLPSIIVTLLFVPVTLFDFDCHPLFVIVISEIYLCLLIIVIGLSKGERMLLHHICVEKMIHKRTF